MRSTEDEGRVRPAGSLCVGVTGSAGAGKSSLAAFWIGRGARLIDGDAVGQALLRADSPVHAEVVRAFGPGVLGPDGQVDRRRLGARVFADSSELARLNCLVHPPLLRELHRQLDQFRASPGPTRVAILDAALLVEWGDRTLWDRLVVVVAPRETQVRRLQAQRGLSPEAADARLRAQLPEERRIPLADHVVVNDGDRAHLEREADRLWREWQELLGPAA